MTKSILVGVKISPEDLELIDKASGIDRRPRSQFMAKASIDCAYEVLKEGEIHDN